jgi:hypothetical protein
MGAWNKAPERSELHFRTLAARLKFYDRADPFNETRNGTSSDATGLSALLLKLWPRRSQARRWIAGDSADIPNGGRLVVDIDDASVEIFRDRGSSLRIP